MEEKDIVSAFRGGMSKAALADMVYYKCRAEKQKITRKEALNLVETAILNSYLKEKNFTGNLGQQEVTNETT